MSIQGFIDAGAIKCDVCSSNLVIDHWDEDEYGPHAVLICPNKSAHPLEPMMWTCNACQAENPDNQPVCLSCGMQRSITGGGKVVLQVPLPAPTPSDAPIGGGNGE